MTQNSTRRAAEMAVIDAAWSFVSARPHADTRLTDAVDEHRRVGLDRTRTPTVGNNTTDTSVAAGASMRRSVGPLAQQCFDEITVVFDNGGVGLTVDQLEQILNRSHQSVSARVNELRDKGWVSDSGQTRKTRSGRKAIIWQPSEMAS